MFNWFRGLWARLAFWRRPPAVLPAKPEVIIGADYLADYQAHYQSFQAAFMTRYRANPDAQYWKDFSLEDIGVIAGDWLLANGRFPTQSTKDGNPNGED